MTELGPTDENLRCLVERLALLYLDSAADAVSVMGSPRRPPDPRTFAAWEMVEAACRIPGVGSRLVIALAAYAETEADQAYLGAGPLEDLINRGDPEDLAAIGAALPASPQLRRALRAVNPPDEGAGQTWLEQHIQR